jgi:hypothetical protein
VPFVSGPSELERRAASRSRPSTLRRALAEVGRTPQLVGIEPAERFFAIDVLAQLLLPGPTVAFRRPRASGNSQLLPSAFSKVLAFRAVVPSVDTNGHRRPAQLIPASDFSGEISLTNESELPQESAKKMRIVEEIQLGARGARGLVLTNCASRMLEAVSYFHGT